MKFLDFFCLILDSSSLFKVNSLKSLLMTSCYKTKKLTSNAVVVCIATDTTFS